MKQVHLAHWACVTPLGAGLDALWRALLEGRDAFRPVRRFATDAYVNNLATCLPELDNPGKTTRLQTLLDMLPAASLPLPGDTLLFTASTKAGIDQLETRLRGGAARMNEILPAHLPEIVARRLAIPRVGRNISAACASGGVALCLAATRVAAGDAPCAVVCGLDLVTEFVFSGFSALKALSPTRCRPFDIHRDGLLLGEAAAVAVLADAAHLDRMGLESLGMVSGWGISSDASHITAPSREGEGLVRAVRQALKVAGIAPEHIAGIIAHGTGTVYNDAMEIEAFSRVFGNSAPRMAGLKGALGHSMGACGVIEALVAARSGRHALLPPTCGLQAPEPAVANQVSSSPQPLGAGCVLSTNSGFGGINAALVVDAVK